MQLLLEKRLRNLCRLRFWLETYAWLRRCAGGLVAGTTAPPSSNDELEGDVAELRQALGQSAAKNTD